MKRYIPLLVALLALVLVALAEVTINRERLEQDRVYTVTEMRAELAHDRAAWLGRTVRVRGFLLGCPRAVCPGHEPKVSPPLLMDLTQPAYGLAVAWTGPDPLSSFLRRLPVVGTLVPAPQVPHWETVATYRVRFHVPAAGTCPSPSCYEAMVLDSAHGSL